MKKLLSLLFFIFLVNCATDAQVTFWADTVHADPGSKVYVSIRVKNFKAIAAFQFSLQWDPAVLKYDTVANFNLPNFDGNSISADSDTIANGRIGTLWFGSGVEGTNVADGTAILDFIFDVVGKKGDSSLISFVESPTPFEVLDKDQNDVGLIPVSGVVRIYPETGVTDISSSANGFTLYNPDPNPFTGVSTIKWDSPVNEKVKIFITDISGKLVYNVNNYNNIKGRNQTTLSSKELPGPGTYIFGIQAGKNILTRKLILMQ